MKQSKSFTVTTTHLLAPMMVLGLTLVFFFGFQMSQVMDEREALRNMEAQISQPHEDALKLNKQFSGLVLGTQKLAAEGVASAKVLENRLIEVGVIQPPVPAEQQAPVPAAQTTEKGPVKP